MILGPILAFALLQAPPQPDDKCAIEGQVIRAGSGDPLKNARVSLRREQAPQQERTALTDGGGRFLFRDVEPGRYRVSVSRNGYLNQEQGQRAPGRPGSVLALEPGQRVRDLVFRLTPWGVIAGRVLDEDGEPMLHVQVQVLRLSYDRGRRQLTPRQGGATNDLGEYRIYNLAPGHYYICAYHTESSSTISSVEMGRTADARADVGYASVYFPGVLDPRQAAPVDVAAGSELRGLDFRLVRTRTVRVRGRVVNTVTGGPVKGTVVFLFPRDAGAMTNQPRSPATVQDAQGNFELRGVVPGSYILSANQYLERKRFAGRLPIEVGDSDLEGVQLSIGLGPEVAGRIRVEGGGEQGAGELTVILQSRDPNPMSGGSARSKPDGNFAIENLLPDTYSVIVAGARGDSYLKSVQVGGVDALESGVTVGSDGTPGPLELVLSPNGGRVEGTITDRKQQPVAGAMVVLLPDEHRRAQLQGRTPAATTDQYGRFTLRALPPGEYTLYAWDEIEPGAYLDPEVLKQYEGRGRSVRITDNSRETVQAEVIAAAEPGR